MPPQRAPRDRQEPPAENGGGDSHHPLPRSRRRRRDEGEDGGQNEKEDAERVPLLHAASLLGARVRNPAQRSE